MREQSRAILGFFSRWLLLGLGGGIAVSAGAIGATAVSPRQQAPRPVVSDGLFVTGPEVEVAARLTPRPSRPGAFRVLLFVGDQATRGPYHEDDVFYLKLPRAEAGEYSIGLAGVPYVCLTRDGEPAKLTMLPAGRRVFLVDGALVTDLLRRDPAAWEWAAATMRARGQLAFVHPGPAEEFETFRSDLRRRGHWEPVLCAFASQRPALATLYRVSLWLGLHKGGAAVVDVVTSDRELARYALGRKMRANWIADGPDRAAADPRVKTCLGMEAFTRALAAETGQ